MKTLLLTATLSIASIINTNGQEVANFYEFSITPSAYAYDGKATAVGVNSDDENECYSIMILDKDMKTTEHFNIKHCYTLQRYIETTTIKKSEFDTTLTQEELDNAEWTKEGNVDQNCIRFYPFDSDFCDYDSNIFINDYPCPVVFTQTLWNDDDKWEYLYPIFGEATKTTSAPVEFGRNENGLVVKRYVDIEQPVIGLAVKNEDGDVIASFQTDYSFDTEWAIVVLAGNIYICLEGYRHGYRNRIIYKYDPHSASIKEVSRTKAKEAKVEVNGRTITIDAIDQKADEAVLFNMSGCKVASARRGTGDNITINANNVPKGIYNVATSSNGRIAGVQKIILK